MFPTANGLVEKASVRIDDDFEKVDPGGRVRIDRPMTPPS
jgi:hypothetical protein